MTSHRSAWSLLCAALVLTSAASRGLAQEAGVAAPEMAAPASAPSPEPEVPMETSAPDTANEGNIRDEPQARSALRDRIEQALSLARALSHQVWALEAKQSLTGEEARALAEQIDAQVGLLGSFDEHAKALDEQRKKSAQPNERSAIDRDEAALTKQLQLAEDALGGVGRQLAAEDVETGGNLVDRLLAARCATAICFDNGESKYWLGIEPLVELPIGVSSALGNTALAEYINNHELRIDLAAGLRLWLFRDVVSVALYFSAPLVDGTIRPEGSDFTYPGSAIRRPFPGVAFGLLYDAIWIGFDRNELRNGDGEASGTLNPDFPPNTVISSAWTVTLALQPVTAYRSAIGTAVQSSKGGTE